MSTITTQNLNREGFFGFMRRRFGIVISLLILLFIAWAAWSWGFCRFYVGPGQMAVITAKSGDELKPGQILARPGQKGILEDVLGEGRHIWNPVFYDWEIVDTIDIPPGKIGVVTSLVGSELPAGEFLARPGQKGTWRKVLGPGRHRLNPYGYAVEIVDAVSIPVGFVGVVTNLSGEASARTDADGTERGVGATAGAGERGTRPDVLQPGLYYINPREFRIAAVEVGVNQVSLVGNSGGVVLTKSVMMDENNQMLQRLNQNLLDEQKRRREEYQQQASRPAPAQSRVQVEEYPQEVREMNADMAYSAPPRTSRGFAEELMEDPGAAARRALARQLPAGSAPLPGQGRMPAMEKYAPPAFIVNQGVNFPSRDGFDISLDMTVEFELEPRHLAAIFSTYGDLPKVVDTRLMPQVLSVSRMKGSSYRAVDFIAGEGREKFQNDLTDSLKEALGEMNIMVHSALISNVNVPAQILDPLRTTSLSRETDLTNREKQNTARKQADLNREMSLIKQSGEQVMQETDKLKAEIDAEMKKTVAMIEADTVRQMAAIDKETVAVRATRTITLGRAAASSVKMVGEERAKGFGMKVRAFGRDGEYALYEFAMRLNPDLKINLIHAGEGTLWTDLKNASMGDLGGASAVRKR